MFWTEVLGGLGAAYLLLNVSTRTRGGPVGVLRRCWPSWEYFSSGINCSSLGFGLPQSDLCRRYNRAQGIRRGDLVAFAGRVDLLFSNPCGMGHRDWIAVFGRAVDDPGIEIPGTETRGLKRQEFRPCPIKIRLQIPSRIQWKLPDSGPTVLPPAGDWFCRTDEGAGPRFNRLRFSK